MRDNLKYANILFNARSANNLGDNIQLLAIDNIYKKMGLSEDDIVYIDKNDLPTYDGEPLILPISLALVDYQEKGMADRFSKKIHPVLLGISLAKDSLYKEEVEYLKTHGPIGCRDERTYNTMQKYNIDCYLSGCITLSFDERETTDNQNKIYIVDVCAETMNNIPENIKKDAIITSHFIKEKIAPKQRMLDQYNMYKDDAKLIITSLLHCTAPCIAAEIPLLCVKSVISYRFGWIDKLINIFNVDQLSSVDWENNENSIISVDNIRFVRGLLTDLTIKRLKNPNEHFPEMDTITDFYMGRNRNNYSIDCFMPYETFIKNNLKDKNAPYKYSIWGLTQMSEMLVEHMNKNFKNSELINVYDKFRQLNFYGKISKPADAKIFDDIDYLFITTNAAEDDARKIANGNENLLRKTCFMKIYK